MENVWMLFDLPWARHLLVVYMKPFHLLLRIHHSLEWFPSILILRASFSLYKILKLFHRFIHSSNISCIRNDLAFDDPFYLPL